MFEKFRVLPYPTFGSFNKFLWKFQSSFAYLVRQCCFLCVFFFNFTRESTSGERPSKIDPLVHARRSDGCVTLGQPNEQGFKRWKEASTDLFLFQSLFNSFFFENQELQEVSGFVSSVCTINSNHVRRTTTLECWERFVRPPSRLLGKPCQRKPETRTKRLRKPWWTPQTHQDPLL